MWWPVTRYSWAAYRLVTGRRLKLDWVCRSRNTFSWDFLTWHLLSVFRNTPPALAISNRVFCRYHECQISICFCLLFTVMRMVTENISPEHAGVLTVLSRATRGQNQFGARRWKVECASDLSGRDWKSISQLLCWCLRLAILTWSWNKIYSREEHNYTN